tara:strand:- start:258 stop:392 length:135 start_codon:yes stop_codon:yes gene_type:complete
VVVEVEVINQVVHLDQQWLIVEVLVVEQEETLVIQLPQQEILLQ